MNESAKDIPVQLINPANFFAKSALNFSKVTSNQYRVSHASAAKTDTGMTQKPNKLVQRPIRTTKNVKSIIL